MGTITYEDGYTDRFDGVLKEEGNECKLLSNNDNVPPDKFEDYEKKNL